MCRSLLTKEYAGLFWQKRSLWEICGALLAMGLFWQKKPTYPPQSFSFVSCKLGLLCGYTNLVVADMWVSFDKRICTSRLTKEVFFGRFVGLFWLWVSFDKRNLHIYHNHPHSSAASSGFFADIHISLWQIYRSLLTKEYVGLIWQKRSLMVDVWVSFGRCVGLFWQICRSFLTCADIQVSCGRYEGLFWQLICVQCVERVRKSSSRSAAATDVPANFRKTLFSPSSGTHSWGVKRVSKSSKSHVELPPTVFPPISGKPSSRQIELLIREV